MTQFAMAILIICLSATTALAGKRDLSKRGLPTEHLHERLETDVLKEDLTPQKAKWPMTTERKSGEVSFVAPAIKIGTAKYSFQQTPGLKVAKKAFSRALTEREQISILLSLSNRVTGRLKDTNLVFAKPLHRAELASLYRRVSGGQEMTALLEGTYLHMLLKDGFSEPDTKKLGFNLNTEQSFQELKHFMNDWLKTNPPTFTQDQYLEARTTRGEYLFTNTNPVFIHAAEGPLYDNDATH